LGPRKHTRTFHRTRSSAPGTLAPPCPPCPVMPPLCVTEVDPVCAAPAHPPRTTAPAPRREMRRRIGWGGGRWGAPRGSCIGTVEVVPPLRGGKGGGGGESGKEGRGGANDGRGPGPQPPGIRRERVGNSSGAIGRHRGTAQRRGMMRSAREKKKNEQKLSHQEAEACETMGWGGLLWLFRVAKKTRGKIETT